MPVVFKLMSLRAARLQDKYSSFESLFVSVAGASEYGKALEWIR